MNKVSGILQVNYKSVRKVHLKQWLLIEVTTNIQLQDNTFLCKISWFPIPVLKKCNSCLFYISKVIARYCYSVYEKQGKKMMPSRNLQAKGAKSTLMCQDTNKMRTIYQSSLFNDKNAFKK